MYLQTLPSVPGWGGGRGQNNCPRSETTALIFKKTAAPCPDKGLLFTLEANRCCPICTPSRPQTPSSSWLTDPQAQIPHGSFHIQLDESKDRVGRAVGEILGASPGNI